MEIPLDPSSLVQSTHMTDWIKGLLTPRNAITLLAVLFFASAGTALYFYTQATTGSTGDAMTEELDRTIAIIGRLVVLPVDERPTLATVSDPEKLRSQPFFANAQKGDKVLIYANARKAILYNPASNKIVEIAPINTQFGASTTP
jgi:hypothetical protein